MGQRFLVVLFLLCSSCVVQNSPQYSANLPHRDTVEESLRATVAITKTNDEGLYISCSGVFIQPELVLTAAHCVTTDVTIQLPFGTLVLKSNIDPVGQDHEIVIYTDYLHNGLDVTHTFTTIAYDEKRDLALLLSAEHETYDISCLRISSATAYVGMPLYSVGHPYGVRWNVSSGYVSSRVVVDEMHVHHLFSNVQAYHGSSGGPILDMDGRIVGICSQIVGEVPYLNKSIYSRSINRFLRENDVL